MKFFKAWEYLNKHGYFLDKELQENYGGEFSAFVENLTIDVYKIDPKIKEINLNEKKNTKVIISIETGECIKAGKDNDLDWSVSHDPALDVQASTFEKAFIKLAKKVERHYPIKEFGVINETKDYDLEVLSKLVNKVPQEKLDKSV